MNNSDEKKRIIEKMSEDINKIAKALELLPKHGLIRRLLILYLQDKTKLGKQKIEALLEGIEEFVRDYQREVDEK